MCGFFSQREWVGFTLEAERKNGPTRLREAQGLRFERIRETSMKPKNPQSPFLWGSFPMEFLT